ncbi:hypothetical protein [Bacillus glycinifermentans]|nr:hypothetical protein [Bacillus glycinifermentans]
MTCENEDKYHCISFMLGQNVSIILDTDEVAYQILLQVVSL